MSRVFEMNPAPTRKRATPRCCANLFSSNNVFTRRGPDSL